MLTGEFDAEIHSPWNLWQQVPTSCPRPGTYSAKSFDRRRRASSARRAKAGSMCRLPWLPATSRTAETLGTFGRIDTMPIFEYDCVACGQEFEKLVRQSSPPPHCPQCSSTDLRKKLSAFNSASAVPTRRSDLSAPCGSCGHPDGPGACHLH